MRTIGVISDTHGLLRDEAVQALRGSDLILHAGDVGDPVILERLADVAPVLAVFGNTDFGTVRQRLPETLMVDLGASDGRLAREGPAGAVAYVLHISENLDIDPSGAGVSLVVTGHTHRPLAERRGGVLYLNPGSAGPRRFDLPVTVARVGVDGGTLTHEILEIL